MTIAMTVVAIKVPLKNVAIANTKRISIISQPANPSSPSVIFMALTILIVTKKVMMG